MPDYIRKGTCGACKEFEFEGNNQKGYCRRYGAYYWDDDSCSHYDEDEDRFDGGSSSPCFLTTACCEHKGLPDDCEELTALRKFRDEHLMLTEEGKALVEEYYNIAPEIVDKIMKNERKDEILEAMYMEICKIVEMLKNNENDMAMRAYRGMVIETQNKLK